MGNIDPEKASDDVQYLSVQDSANTVFNAILDNNDSKVSYSDILEMATDLCRTVSDSPKLCKSTYATLFEWITKLREGEDFDIKFCNKALPRSKDANINVNPLPAVITPGVTGRKRRGRYKSSEELKRKAVGKSTTSICTNIVYINNRGMHVQPDENFVSKGNKERRFCSLCR